MGALATKALRPLKSFNIENRAHRVISKEKPTPAPRYPSNEEDLKRTMEARPNLDDLLDKKDPSLHDRLKGVYVTSHGRPEDDITKETRSQNPNRPLPQDRKMVEDFDYGFKEPDRIPYGRTTLRNVINFISAHQMNPEEVTVSKIALEYKLKEEDVENILKYFKTYEVYIPETKKAPAIFAGPATLRKQLQTNTNIKEIEEKDVKKEKEKSSFFKIEIENKINAARNDSIGAGSIGAASLGAQREAPAPPRAPSVRSDERPLATQGDMLNSIKFQRRYRDTLEKEKMNKTLNDKLSVSKDKDGRRREGSFQNVISVTTTPKTSQLKPGPYHSHYIVPRETLSPTRGSPNLPRPLSPKGRRVVQNALQGSS